MIEAMGTNVSNSPSVDASNMMELVWVMGSLGAFRFVYLLVQESISQRNV
jgi:hypothetical protein